MALHKGSFIVFSRSITIRQLIKHWLTYWIIWISISKNFLIKSLLACITQRDFSKALAILVFYILLTNHELKTNIPTSIFLGLIA